MKLVESAVVALGIAVFCGCQRIPVEVAPSVKIPEAARAGLMSDQWELLSLTPGETRRPKEPEFGFHGWEILGRTELKEAGSRQRVLAALNGGVDGHNGTVAACFYPRHGIRTFTTEGTVVSVGVQPSGWETVPPRSTFYKQKYAVRQADLIRQSSTNHPEGWTPTANSGVGSIHHIPTYIDAPVLMHFHRLGKCRAEQKLAEAAEWFAFYLYFIRACPWLKKDFIDFPSLSNRAVVCTKLRELVGFLDFLVSSPDAVPSRHSRALLADGSIQVSSGDQRRCP